MPLSPTGDSESARPRARRWRLAAFALVGLCALAGLALWFAASTLALTGAGARADIEERLTALTGRAVIVDGEASFSFFPKPVLTLDRVRIGTGEEDGPRLTVNRIVAQLDLSDALLGRTDIARLTLLRPQSFYEERDDGAERVHPAERAAPRSLGAVTAEGLAVLREHAERFAGVRSVEIRDGAATPADGGLGVSGIDLVLEWPAPDAPAALTGSFVWQGEQTQISLRSTHPQAFLAGASSDTRFELAAPPVRLRFDGTAHGREELGLDGSLSFSSPSQTRAAAWLTGSRSRLPDLGPISGEGQLALSGDEIALRSARLGLGGETGTGSIELTLDGRTGLTGTLAFSSLDFDRIAGAVAPFPRHALDFQRPIAIGFIEDFDLDLRLSVGEGSFGNLPLRQFAATVKFARGQGMLDIGDAELLGGRAQARLSVDMSGARPQARARLDLTDIDAGGLASLLRLEPLGASGRADATLDFSGPVTSWETILRENEIAARLSLREGGMAGLSPALFAEPGERPIVLSASGEAMAFSALEAILRSRGPYANLERLALSGPNGRVEASGFFSLLDNQLLVNGRLLPRESADADGAFTPLQEMGFTIGGEWPHPTLSVREVERPM